MTISIEERLVRAAAVLDAHADQRIIGRVADQRYLLDETTHRRSSGAIMTAAAAVVVAALVGVVAVERQGDSGQVVAPAASAPEPGQPTWDRLPAAPISPRFQHLAVTTDNGLFVWGGFAGDTNKTDGALYDAGEREWRKLPRSPLATDRGDAIGAWTGSEVIVVNGVDGDVRAAAFDPGAFAWRALPDPPLTNAASGMARVVPTGDGVVVIGVSTEGEGGARNEVARYDAAADRWEISESPPASFGSGFDAVTVGDEIVIVGRRGFGGAGCGQSVVLAYDPATNSWRALPDGPLADRNAPVVAGIGDELFAAGGFACGEETPNSEAYVLDPATGSWRNAASAPAGVHGNDRYAEPSNGRQVFTIDGTGSPAVYDSVLDQWNEGPAHPVGSPVTETPWSWVADVVIVFSGGLSGSDGGCCDTIDGGYAYMPGDGDSTDATEPPRSRADG